MPHETERACAFLSLVFFFFFFSSHKNDYVFRSHRMIFVTFYLLEAISQSHNDLVTLILRSLVFTFSLFWSLQRKVQNKLTSIIYDLMWKNSSNSITFMNNFRTPCFLIFIIEPCFQLDSSYFMAHLSMCLFFIKWICKTLL